MVVAELVMLVVNSVDTFGNNSKLVHNSKGTPDELYKAVDEFTSKGIYG